MLTRRMLNLYDIAYGAGIALAAPVWLALPKARRKVLLALRQRMGQGIAEVQTSDAPTVLIHAVSLGEINATRALVTQLAAARPGLRFVVTVTTETGFARGQQLYGNEPAVTLVRYPLDFSGPIARLLDGCRVRVAVLMELEVWPNFIYQCRRRDIPVLLINGRLTASSFANYRRAKPLLAATFRRLALACAQDQAYADRFVALGVPADRVRVTGTMKFDTAEITDAVSSSDALAAEVGLLPGGGPLWVCGSTGPGEEAIVLDVYRSLLNDHPTLRLAIIPRHPDRFDAVAEVIRDAGFSVVRRSGTLAGAPATDASNGTSDAPGRGSQASRPNGGSGELAPAAFPPVAIDPTSLFRAAPPVILGDTMGELRKFYSLSAVVLVGRSMVDLGPRQHGSDMIEPAALAKPVVVGPFTHNFAEVMTRFVEADAIRVAPDAAALAPILGAWLADPAAAASIGERARAVVARERGATARHATLILAALERAPTS